MIRHMWSVVPGERAATTLSGRAQTTPGLVLPMCSLYNSHMSCSFTTLPRRNFSPDRNDMRAQLQEAFPIHVRGAACCAVLCCAVLGQGK